MSHRLYGTMHWRRRARLQLIRFPLCAACLREGRGAVAAKVADHVKPWNGDVNEFFLSELQSLCVPCHSGKKQRLDRLGYDDTTGSDGLPVDPHHPIYRDDPKTEPVSELGPDES
jgi:5-methylcytosine-specific restriction enzyme A